MTPQPEQQPHEPVMIRFVSEMSGNVYDEETVDHMADMLLIFYAGGGAALGAILGAMIGASFFLKTFALIHVLVVLPSCGSIGALLGSGLVLLALNFRGLLAWDHYEFKRTFRLKQQAAPSGSTITPMQ